MISIDMQSATVTVSGSDVGEDGEGPFRLDSDEGFAIVSRAWLRSGWDAKYVYGFSWLGRPVIQLPDDMIRIQEVVHAVAPTVIVETGVAHGGSLIYYASLCKALDRGRVIGIDIDIRPPNRAAIEAHPLSGLITLVEGSSTAPEVVSAVRDQIVPDDVVLVLLDSNHSQEHVLAELHAYADLVSVGSYIVATDGIMSDLVGAPRSQADWATNNPRTAALRFAAERDDFAAVEPDWPFNEGNVRRRVTYWPDAYLRRLK